MDYSLTSIYSQGTAEQIYRRPQLEMVLNHSPKLIKSAVESILSKCWFAADHHSQVDWLVLLAMFL